MSCVKSLKVVAIIQARLTSTRLPRKILQKIGNKTILQHCIDNTRKAKWLDEVIIASPHSIPEHDNIEIWNSFSEKDVLTRYYLCADVHKADIIVRITADCPFIDSDIIDLAIEYFITHSFEYICFAPIDGLDVEVFSFELLKETWKKAKTPYDREHVTPYMRRKTKLSIDTKQDLQKARRWYGLQR